MCKWLKNHVTHDMIRPILYKSTSRLLYMLTLALLWDRFLNRSAAGLSTAFVLIAVIFGIGAWLARLRLDGIAIPKLPERKPFLKDQADALCGDMIDHVDTPVINFGDLDDDEQNTCLILADLICCVIYLVASFFV